MNKIQLVRTAAEQQLTDIYDLLAMRILFPPDRVEVTIDKEIKDLFLYPERLETSYRDEWTSIATKALFNHGFADHWRSDQDNLDRYLGFLKEQSIPRCIHNHVGLFQMLGEAIAVQRSENTLAFPDPRRRALMRMIWPETPD
ncbi:MAG: hypothetical protein HLUCCX14_08645 [Marinobacter excellens HL-55]|uniref:Uncharacterized protein n=1 Tax=Marinobacter excellens HL-55 TaxID=1305731 RepID=A0A0N8KKS4_9GAMM|nr:MAG: hypothetical protein HLUCCX14_08645 [Marinobacter excellens HL-55]